MESYGSPTDRYAKCTVYDGAGKALVGPPKWTSTPHLPDGQPLYITCSPSPARLNDGGVTSLVIGTFMSSLDVTTAAQQNIFYQLMFNGLPFPSPPPNPLPPPSPSPPLPSPPSPLPPSPPPRSCYTYLPLPCQREYVGILDSVQSLESNASSFSLLNNANTVSSADVAAVVADLKSQITALVTQVGLLCWNRVLDE